MFYLSQGRVDQALLWIFNDYIGYGIIWLLWGIAILSVTYEKNKSAAISGFVFSLFLSLVNWLLPVEIQAYFALIAGVLLFMVIYRIVR